jgi:hypothetical protein
LQLLGVVTASTTNYQLGSCALSATMAIASAIFQATRPWRSNAWPHEGVNDPRVAFK